jgi:hypothetical protein
MVAYSNVSIRVVLKTRRAGSPLVLQRFGHLQSAVGRALDYACRSCRQGRDNGRSGRERRQNGRHANASAIHIQGGLRQRISTKLWMISNRIPTPELVKLFRDQLRPLWETLASINQDASGSSPYNVSVCPLESELNEDQTPFHQHKDHPSPENTPCPDSVPAHG